MKTFKKLQPQLRQQITAHSQRCCQGSVAVEAAAFLSGARGDEDVNGVRRNLDLVDRANLTGLVLGCVGAKICKKICV